MFIDNVFYINLARRLDRRTIVENQLHEFAMNYVRWEGVDGARAEVSNKFHKYTERGAFDYLRKLKQQNTRQYHGVLGFYLSHVTLLEYINSLKCGVYLVFEDDMQLSRGFLDRLDGVLENVPDDWDLIRIDCTGKRQMHDLIAPNVFALRTSYSTRDV